MLAYCSFKVILLLIFLNSFCISFLYSSGQEFIRIPFTRKNKLTTQMTEEQVLNALESPIYLSNFYVGTPYQNLTFDLTLDKSYSYLLSEDLELSEEIEVTHDFVKFNESKSSTFKIGEKVTFFSYFDDANFMKDNFKILDYEFKNFTFIDVKKLDSLQVPSYSGVLGLGTLAINQTKYLSSNLIYNLKESNAIKNYNYFFEPIPGKASEKNSNIFLEEGNLVIGVEPYEYNSTSYPNKINSFARLPSYGITLIWGFGVDKIAYRGNTIDTYFSYAQIKLNYGFILVNDKIQELLDQELFSELKNQGICKEIHLINMITNYVCQKDKVNKAKLGLLSVKSVELRKEFIFDLSKLFYDYEDKTYFLVQFRKFGQILILGNILLRDNTLVFNQDSKTLGIFSYIEETKPIDKKKDKKLLETIVIIIILSIIIIVSLLVFLRHKKIQIPKKKKGIELIENDGYNEI